MWSLLIYSVKASVILAAAYLLFRLLLRKETFHCFNRSILLATVVLSLALPFCTLKRVEFKNVEVTDVYWEKMAAKRAQYRDEILELGLQVMSSKVTPNYSDMAALSELTKEARENLLLYEQSLETELWAVPGKSQSLFWWQSVLTALFVLGAVTMFVRLTFSFLTIAKTVSRGEKHPLAGGGTLVIGSSDCTPSSWFGFIFLSQEDYFAAGSPDLRGIISHEQAHISLHHTWDLLLVDLATVLQWYNPAIWILRMDLVSVHEYQADKAVLQKGFDAREYQYLLLRRAMNNNRLNPGNRFAARPIKERIGMLVRRSSPSERKFKAAYIVVIIACALYFGGRIETRTVLDGDAYLPGLDLQAGKLHTIDFIKTFETEYSWHAFLAGKKIDINSPESHRLTLTKGGLVKPGNVLGGIKTSEIITNLWKPQPNHEDHFYLVRHHSLLIGDARTLEVTRSSFEKELYQGTNRKVLLYVPSNTKKRLFVVFR